MGRRHCASGWSEQQPLEQRRSLRTSPGASLSRSFRKDRLHLIPDIATDDGMMLAGIRGALVHSLTDIDRVVEQLIDDALVQWPAPS